MRKFRPHAPVGLLLLFALAGCSSSGIAVFEGARLIVGDGSAPIENATFIVQAGHFTQVGAASEVQVPDGADRIDLAGRTVMPAIIDTHTHLSNTREALAEDLQRRAYYGVAAAMSLGQDAGELPFQVRAEVVPDTALFRTAGRGITAPEPGRSEVPYWITTEEEARAAVQELARQQVDIVKIWVDDRDGMYEKLSPALYTAVIDEAHQHGLRVTAHIFTLEDAKGLLRAGIDAFAHGVRDQDVDDEIVALFRERPDVVLVPNLPDRGVATDLSWLGETVAPDALRELQAAATDRPEAQQVFALQARNLARLNQAGVRIAVGTDGNRPWAPHEEMLDMVSAGMTPMQVIVSATRNAADLMGLTDGGAIAPGKSADFLVLEANPLDDITNTRRIETVYLRGSAVDRAMLRSRWTSQTSE